MDWDLFDTHGEDKRRAFEALAGQLFECWCRRTFRTALREVRFVEGSGGDGGVEAYALVASAGSSEPDVIGLQAKWFQNTLKQDQFRQVDRSLRTAVQVRGADRLKHYCIAVPRRLNDERRGTKKSERARWDEWVEKAMAYAPNTAVELWDDARLETELGEPENEGLSAYWFTRSTWTLHDLARRFEASRAGWLSHRYLPDLHVVSQLETDLRLRLGTVEARSDLLKQVQNVVGVLRSTRDDIARLPRYREFMALADAGEMLKVTLDALDRQLERAEVLMDALRRGQRVDCLLAEGKQSDRAILQPYEDFRALRRLHRSLHELDRKGPLSRAPTYETARRLAGCLHGDEGLGAIARLDSLWDCWQQAPKWVAYTGPPGVGKTHGIAHAVQTRLDAKLPAVLLRAKDCPVDGGWAAIVRSALEALPGARLEEMCNAMEATAVRADIQRARAGTGQLGKSGVEMEPTCFLLGIDGLEEGGRHSRWAELLGELDVHLHNHPRLRVAVTLRTTSSDAILGKVRRDRFEERVLSPDEDDVQRLLRRYCEHDAVALPDRRLRWALREPLSVRLYCELKASQHGWGLERRSLSLPALLGKKLDLAENAISQQGGFGPHDRPLRTVLGEIARACIEKGQLSRDDAIPLARKAMPAVDSVERWSWVLDQAEAHGLLLVHTHEPDDPTDRRPCFVELSYEPLTDYLIAKAATGEIARAIEQRDACAGPALGAMPRVLRIRPDARTQTAILLASKHGISLVESGVFRDALPQDEIDRLELRAIAALEGNDAARYRHWVLERLRASMPSCRRVLKELCIPVARDLEHPFAPRFVHEALLPLLPAKRDLFWSGPRKLPGDGAQPWEGWGDEALEHLTLEPDDQADGPPLLLAWALTSVDNRWRRQVRAELAQWGARQLGELVRWLELATQSNDPQMIEDVAMTAFGAACLAGVDPRLGDLVRWVDARLLALDSPRRQENIIVLHAARGIVERAHVMGIAVDAAVLGRARSLYRPDARLLELDVEAARAADDHDGITPITSDLAWYVVPEAIEGFFESTAHSPRADLDAMKGMTPKFIHAALDGALGALTEETRQTIQDELERRQREPTPVTLFHFADESDTQTLEVLKSSFESNQPMDDSDHANVTEEELPIIQSIENVVMNLDPRARNILLAHAERAQLPALSPQRFAFGVLMWHLRKTGWNEDDFRVDLRNGEAGEGLGMDATIRREYFPSRHGERSPICTVGEKYVWTGCHLLQAYLAAQAPFRSHEWGWSDPPVDPVLVLPTGINPASDSIPDFSFEDGDWTFWADNDIVASLPLSTQNQPDRAVQWVRNAPLPDLRPWLMLPKDVGPPVAMEEDWVTLRCFVVAREKDSQADSVLWVWSAAIANDDVWKLERDIRIGIEHLPYPGNHGFSESFRGDCVEPSEATWAPWATGVGGRCPVTTLDGSGNLRTFHVDALTASATRESASTDRIWFPAHWIRTAIGLPDARPGRGGAEWHWLDRAGNVQAIYVSHGGDGQISEALLMRRQPLEMLLAEKGLTLLWNGRLLRELSGAMRLTFNDERRHIQREWSWIGVLRNSNIELTFAPDHVDVPITIESAASSPPSPPARGLVPVGPVNPGLSVPLSSDLDRDDAIPYFLWDDPIPVRELRRRLATAAPREQDRLLGKILREARDTDVWKFTTPGEVVRRFSALKRHLGRRRPFWEFLLNRWHKEGLLAEKPA